MSAATILFAVIAVMASAAFMWLYLDAFRSEPQQSQRFNNAWSRVVLFATMIGASSMAAESDNNAHPRLTSSWLLCAVPGLVVVVLSLVRHMIRTRRQPS